MRLLLDSHVLLWWIENSKKLPDKARTILSDVNNVAYFSACSIWEIAVKLSAGAYDLLVDPAQLSAALTDGGFMELPILSSHAAKVAELPGHHRDPFDRMLIAQSWVEQLALITHNKMLTRYSDTVVLV